MKIRFILAMAASCSLNAMHVQTTMQNMKVTCGKCRMRFETVAAYLAHKSLSTKCKKSIGQFIVTTTEISK